MLEALWTHGVSGRKLAETARLIGRRDSFAFDLPYSHRRPLIFAEWQPARGTVRFRAEYVGSDRIRRKVCDSSRRNPAPGGRILRTIPTATAGPASRALLSRRLEKSKPRSERVL